MKDWPFVEVVPGAAELLSAVHADWIIGIATNAGSSNEGDIREALRRGNLDQWLDKIYCYKTMGFYKPSREFFEFIITDLGLVPRSIFMVGDDFEADVLGANRCGIRAVWFNSLGPEKRVTKMARTIHRLSDLPGILEGWE